MFRFEPVFALAGSVLDKALAGVGERYKKQLLVAGAVGAALLAVKGARGRRRRLG